MKSTAQQDAYVFATNTGYFLTSGKSNNVLFAPTLDDLASKIREYEIIGASPPPYIDPTVTKARSLSNYDVIVLKDIIKKPKHRNLEPNVKQIHMTEFIALNKEEASSNLTSIMQV